MKYTDLKTASDDDLFEEFASESARMLYDQKKFSVTIPALHWKAKRGSVWFLKEVLAEMERRAL